MEGKTYQEGIIYITDSHKFNKENYNTFVDVMQKNCAVGFVTGYYDDKLSISSVNSYFLHNLGYNYDEFMEATSGSILNLFYGENKSFLKKDRFCNIKGEGEGLMLTKDKVPVYTHMFKTDSVDSEGRKFWILSAQLDWTQQNIHLVNNLLQSGFWYFDCNGNGEITNINYSHEFRHMLGYQDILDFPNMVEAWKDLVHPDDLKKVMNQMCKTLADKTNQTKYDVEYRMKAKDNKYHWFKASAEVTRGLDGIARHVVGIFVNIDKNKAEQRRKQRTSAFHRVYSEANLCEYYVDLLDNTFDSLKTDDSLLQIFKDSKTWDELIKAYINNYVCDDDKEAVALVYNREYILQNFKEGKREVSIECKIMIHGEQRWVRNVVIYDDAIAAPRYAMIFVRDITKAKKEADHIRELTRQNKAMDMLIQATVKIVDRFAMCDFEKGTYELFWFDKSCPYEPRGDYKDLVTNIDASYKMVAENESIKEIFSMKNIQKFLKTPEDIYRFEYCTYNEVQFKTMTITPLIWKNGKAQKILMIVQDTTQEKLMEIESRKALKDAYETANRANRAKTDFLSNMSHDIRTPMNAIVGMTAIAGANIDNREKVKDCLEKITQSSRHLLNLINEVLDMSRIESGRITLSEEKFNLSALVDNLVSMIEPNMQLHNHHFEAQINNIRHEDVFGDTLRIQQLITNIIGNSIKYTPDGGNITLNIREIPVESDEIGCYEFIIEDNGIGISEDFQKVMFEPFTREDDKRTTNIQGTGLGMSIAYNIARMMNGHINVKSEIGKGSRFTITIFLKLQKKDVEKIDNIISTPVPIAEKNDKSCENDLTELTRCDYAGKNILLVEDNELNSEIAKEIIEMTGAVVTTANNGKAAVEKFAASPEGFYDLIFMDIQMPVMNGYEATAAIRSLKRKDAETIPIAAMTANAFAEDVLLSKNAGMNVHIAKPLDLGKMDKVLKEWLK